MSGLDMDRLFFCKRDVKLLEVIVSTGTGFSFPTPDSTRFVVVGGDEEGGDSDVSWYGFLDDVDSVGIGEDDLLMVVIESAEVTGGTVVDDKETLENVIFAVSLVGEVAITGCGGSIVSNPLLVLKVVLPPELLALVVVFVRLLDLDRGGGEGW